MLAIRVPVVAASAAPPQRKQPDAQEAEQKSEAAPLPFGPATAVVASALQAAAEEGTGGGSSAIA